MVDHRDTHNLKDGERREEGERKGRKGGREGKGEGREGRGEEEREERRTGLKRGWT